MIRPIYFDTDSYFSKKKLAEMADTREISDGLSYYGPTQCVVQNSCSQINYYRQNWKLLSVPHIKIQDAINGNYDTDTYLEIATPMWFLLEDRSWVKGKNIIITNMHEAWLKGMRYTLDLPEHEIDISVAEDCKLANHCIIVSDNASKVDGVDCVPSHAFYMDTRDSYKTYAPWCDDLRSFSEDNISKLGTKPKQYIALLGREKPHRTDFYKKISASEVDGYVGGFEDYGRIEFDDPQYYKDFYLKDRYLAKEWFTNTEVWVSHETQYIWKGMDPDAMSSPLTEKVWKPIAFGMPFLLNSSQDCLDRVNEMGFNNFTEVFGNYHTDDFTTTNDNIIDILKNYKSFDIEQIKSICLYNYNHFENMTSDKYIEMFWKELGISYT